MSEPGNETAVRQQTRKIGILSMGDHSHSGGGTDALRAAWMARSIRIPVAAAGVFYRIGREDTEL